MKKVLAWLLTLVMLMGLVPLALAAEWAEVPEGDEGEAAEVQAAAPVELMEDPVMVAQIGDTQYSSLAAAVADNNNGTVTLLRDAEGDGIVFDGNKNLVVDLNGFTYKLNGNTVGSAGTETNGFQLLKGAKVTFRNGTIEFSKYAMGFQSYCSLTLKDLDVKTSGAVEYVLSCNYGSAVLTNVNITGKNNVVALDVMHWHGTGYEAQGPVVIVDNTADNTIQGAVAVYCYGVLTGSGDVKAELSVLGGRFTANVADYVDEDRCCRAEDDGLYTVYGTHSYVGQVTKGATCAEKGEMTYTCRACGHWYKTETAAAGHSWQTAWTGDENGHRHVCGVCGAADAASETVHSFTDEVTQAAGYGTAGIRTYTCGTCGWSYTEEIPALVRPVTPGRPSAPAVPEVPGEELEDPDVPLTEAPMLFEDVAESAWYYGAVDYVFHRGLMVGTNEAQTLFSPEAASTRGMVVTILHRMNDGKTPATPAVIAFRDVAADSWYAGAVAWASSNGIVEGYGDGSFGGEDQVTRQQMVAMLYRYVKKLGVDTQAAGDLSAFADGDSVADWAREAMAWAVGVGLVKGVGDGRLDPNGAAIRVQMATLIQRLSALVGGAAVVV